MKNTKGLIGKKIGMHQLFSTEGKLIPVSIIEVLPNVVTQIKNNDKDDYQALQLATGYRRPKLIKKPLLHHLKKAKIDNKRILSEFRNMKGFDLGQEVKVSLFKVGEFVDIQAISKGKGTSGVIKRHNFSRGPMSHGSKHHRAPGSIGISRPDKVWKGQPMPGRKGNSKVTLQNLEIVAIIEDKNLLIVKGSFPGPTNSFCKIYTALKKNPKQKPVEIWHFEKKIPKQSSTTEIKLDKNAVITPK